MKSLFTLQEEERILNDVWSGDGSAQGTMEWIRKQQRDDAELMVRNIKNSLLTFFSLRTIHAFAIENETYNEAISLTLPRLYCLFVRTISSTASANCW